jgi:hypothetical protein
MKKLIASAGALVLFAALGAADAVAKGGKGNGNGNGHGNKGAATTGLNRADMAAGNHGTKGRANARAHGANAQGFCPPGQQKKVGTGSRFQC